MVDFLKKNIDMRRPVIGDVADNSDAITDLNNPAKVKNMPPNIRYGEIIYEKTNLGVLKLIPLIRTSLYSVFDGLPILPPAVDLGPSLSAAAREFILGAGKTPESYPGDGLIYWKNQIGRAHV